MIKEDAGIRQGVFHYYVQIHIFIHNYDFSWLSSVFKVGLLILFPGVESEEITIKLGAVRRAELEPI